MKDKQSYETRDEICLLSVYYVWCSNEWQDIYERIRIQSRSLEHFLFCHAVLINGAMLKISEICLLSVYYVWCSKEWQDIYERKRIQSCATEHFLFCHAVLINGAMLKMCPTHHSLLKSNLLFD